MPEPLEIKIGEIHGKWNLPFSEAIAAAVARKVALPDAYYGDLQGQARQLAFSVAGLASLDQVQAVKDSMDKSIQKGLSFGEWKKLAAVSDLGLPNNRLDNIFRTNLQGNYMAGRWAQFMENKANRGYLQYDAINDSRVRPAHLAMDGTIRAIDDPFWSTHSPPNGYRCRCSLFSLSESQAHARSGIGTGMNKVPMVKDPKTGQETPAMPDKGWDYSPYQGRMEGVEKAIQQRKDKNPGSPMVDALSAMMEKSAILLIVNTIYETAKSGGEYYKHYERYKDEYLPRLRRAERSYEKVIAEHEEWIKNPESKLGTNKDPDYVRLYTEGKWPEDIARNRAYKSIIEGIIEDRTHGKPD